MKRVSLALVAVTGCANASGIVLTVDPVDQAVMGADRLEVYVGREIQGINPLLTPAIRVHFDDGQMTPFALEAAFTAPIEVLLDGDGSEAPFWVTVRALDGDRVVGEGGVGHELAIAAGEVTTESASIERVFNEPRFMANCPGFHGDGGLNHYIVKSLGTDDCDADHETTDDGDCDDFDPSVNTSAQDATCDGIDQTCGSGTLTTEICLLEDGSGCRLGTQTCDERDGTGMTPCSPAFTSEPLPATACIDCGGETSDALLDCLADKYGTATCSIAYSVDAFCLPAIQPAIDPSLWYADLGPQEGTPGLARWVDPRPGAPSGPVTFGWVEGASFVNDVTLQWPPWPALESNLPIDIVDGSTEDRIVIVVPPSGMRSLVIATMAYHSVDLAGECPIDTQPDCTGFPVP